MKTLLSISLILLLCSNAWSADNVTVPRSTLEELRSSLFLAQVELTQSVEAEAKASQANTRGLEALTEATLTVLQTRANLDLARAEQENIARERDLHAARSEQASAKLTLERVQHDQTKSRYTRLRIWLAGLAAALVIASGWKLFSALGPYGWGIGAAASVSAATVVYSLT